MASASFRALLMNSLRLFTRRRASASSTGSPDFSSSSKLSTFSRSMMHFSLPRGTPQASATI